MKPETPVEELRIVECFNHGGKARPSQYNRRKNEKA
jgi:hypothetical protein